MTPLTLAEAEQDLTAAYLDGNPERIAAAEALVDKLDVPKAAPTLASAALWYVEQGFPVFPILVGRKIPSPKCVACKDKGCPGPEACGHELCHGFKDATTDRATVADWWTRFPHANIGLATGHLFDVVDVDGPLGQASRAKHWDDIFGQIDADAVAKVLTPRPGGMHLYVPPTGDGNSTSIVAGVDYRGLGGYVLAPPSVIAAGGKDHPGTYRFLGTPSLDVLTVRKAS